MDSDHAATLLALARKDSRSAEEARALHECLGHLDSDIRRIVAVTVGGRRGALGRARLTSEDIAQEVLVRMAEGRLPENERGHAPERVLVRWVRVVAMNVLINALRRKGNTEEELDSGDDAAAAADLGRRGATTDLDPVERRDLVRLVEDCVEKLSELRARLWRTMEVDPDVPTDELAVKLGYVPDASGVDDDIRGRIFVLRAAMRRDMAECMKARGFARGGRAARSPGRAGSMSKGGSP